MVMTTGSRNNFWGHQKKAFGNSTQKLYFIRNNSFRRSINTPRSADFILFMPCD